MQIDKLQKLVNEFADINKFISNVQARTSTKMIRVERIDERGHGVVAIVSHILLQDIVDLLIKRAREVEILMKEEIEKE